MFSGIANEISCYRPGKLVSVLPSAGHLGSSLRPASLWMVFAINVAVVAHVGVVVIVVAVDGFVVGVVIIAVIIGDVEDLIS